MGEDVEEECDPCPECDGQGCQDCDGEGEIPRKREIPLSPHPDSELRFDDGEAARRTRESRADRYEEMAERYER